MLLKLGSTGPDVKRVQVRLAELGFFRGKATGNYGPLTEKAVWSFQEVTEIGVDGKVGPETWGALFHEDPPAQAATKPPPPDKLPEWMGNALAALVRGVREISGDQDSPEIVEYFQHTTLKAQDDETPWCAAFVCAMLEEAGEESTRSALAASFRDWGQELEYGQFGAVVVMTRPGGNHVGFYLDEDEAGVYVLGGNQGNRVSVARFSWNVVTNFRWPD